MWARRAWRSRAAAELLDDFADGVWFVNLAPLSDPNLLAATIAQTLGVRESGGQPIQEVLKNYLRAKQVLVAGGQLRAHCGGRAADRRVTGDSARPQTARDQPHATPSLGASASSPCHRCRCLIVHS